MKKKNLTEAEKRKKKAWEERLEYLKNNKPEPPARYQDLDDYEWEKYRKKILDWKDEIGILECQIIQIEINYADHRFSWEYGFGKPTEQE